jgi:hypothetical protein
VRERNYNWESVTNYISVLEGSQAMLARPSDSSDAYVRN